MRPHLLLRFLVATAAATAIGLVGPGAQAAPSPDDRTAVSEVTAADAASEAASSKAVPSKAVSSKAAEKGHGHGITAEQLKALTTGRPGAKEPPPGGWPVPSDRAYYLTASCRQYAAVIARGAAAWANLNETSNSDTPVECRNTYITDCGGGGRIVGCNWGRGQRIALYMGGVGDQALLAAHEFGHDWYGHSGYQCAGWTNPQHVMAPSICGYGPSGERKPVRVD
ncbi:hypothetical protein [Streptomyces sp. G45]|uniref:hypothetical protein n=1 Tax=Streptomyces sp. G45 TaxID=3406627 RepID=UPI003C2838FD